MKISQPELDITSYPYEKVLEGKSNLSKLQEAINEVNFDRILQAFIEEESLKVREMSNPNETIFLAGQLDMAKKIKKFICNISNVSKDTDSIESEDVFLEELGHQAISEADLAMAAKLGSTLKEPEDA